eukprot:scaffold10939_cov105-Cylindrotheca_fusiformis.AAC.1
MAFFVSEKCRPYVKASCAHKNFAGSGNPESAFGYRQNVKETGGIHISYDLRNLAVLRTSREWYYDHARDASVTAETEKFDSFPKHSNAA